MDKWLQRRSKCQTPGTSWDDGNCIPQLAPNRISCKARSSPVNTKEHMKRSVKIGDKESLKRQRKFSFLTVTLKYRVRTMRGSGELVFGSITFNLDLNSPLPSREAVMKNKHNKRGLSHFPSTFNLGCGVSVESRDDGVFLHDEPDTTIISYLFQAADACRQNSQRQQ